MPRRKKKAVELTKEEAAKKLFRKPLRDELDRIAHEKDGKGKRASS